MYENRQIDSLASSRTRQNVCNTERYDYMQLLLLNGCGLDIVCIFSKIAHTQNNGRIIEKLIEIQNQKNYQEVSTNDQKPLPILISSNAKFPVR